MVEEATEEFEEEEFWEDEEEEWEDPFSCFGSYKPGIEECEVCPMRDLCEEVTDNSRMINEEEDEDTIEKECDGCD